MSKSSLKMNFLYNSIYQLLLILLPFITSPYISRILGSKGIGEFSYSFSIASTFALFGMLGVNNYGNRTIASVQNNKYKRSEYFWNIFTIQVVSSLIILFVYLIYIEFFVASSFKSLMYIHILTVLCSLFDINWFFFGMEKFKLTVTRNLIIKILSVLFIFLFVKTKNDTWKYTIIIVGSLFLSNLAVWPFLKKEIFIVKPKIKNILPHINKMVVLFIPVLAITLYKRIDKIMLGTLSTMSETGYFENTEKIISIPLGLITALGTVMLPRMSHLISKGEKEKTELYIESSMEFISFLSCAMAFGIAAIAEDFAPLFFGSSFVKVSELIIYITPTVIFISWANVIRTQYLMPLKKDNIYVTSVWIGAVINLVLNVFLVESYGAKGAIIGTVAAEFSVMFYQLYKVRKDLPLVLYLRNSRIYLISGLFMFLIIKILFKNQAQSIFNLVLQVLVGAIVYLILTAPRLYRRMKKVI